MAQQQRFLVTGGAGYVGSHSLVALLEAGHDLLVVDNFANSVPEALRRVASLTQRHVAWRELDIRDADALNALFAECAQAGAPITAVMHFAALKAVGESVGEPLRYYDNNVHGTLVLLAAMRRAGVRQIVFSSSATVYGEPEHLPFTESHRIAPSNPYGQTKAMVEQILRDVCTADESFSAISLRYFNPIGAHPSGLIGEDPHEIPNNLFPFITRVAIGQLAELRVFGDDYPTADGTGLRDYIHVMDLARGHEAAVRQVSRQTGFTAINLGTGRGTTVLQLIATFARVNQVSVSWRRAPRRPGDVAAAWADVSRAAQLLQWQATLDLEAMCRDGWNWQRRNPRGYRA